jgi:dihydrodipicolinate synthase/N-acetylneuraminate lyase
VLRGIVTPLVTPLISREKLDCGAVERLVEHVISGGVDGIFILGTTGEGPSLSYRLREEMLRHACTVVRKRVPVLVSVSDTSLTESEKFADLAAHAGAQAVVLAPPYYFDCSQSDLTRYIEVAAFRFSLPIYLYNIPQLTKVAFAPATVCHAARIPGVAGIKDSSGDLNYLAQVIEAVKPYPEFTVLNGPEEILLDAMRAGAHGGVCGGSNLNPALFAEFIRAASAQDWEAAERCQAQVQKISSALYNCGYPGTSYLRGLKCALELAGFCRAELALPLTKFNETEYFQIVAAFQGLG